MTDEHQHRASERIRVELVEADVEIGFGLVDSALGELHAGDLPFAQRALQDAEKVLIDIEQSLQELDTEHSRPFGPLVDELRRAVHAAESNAREGARR
jgi:hypothetical protein